MRFSHSVNIDAPPERVWSVYADVEHWPDWTASVSSVEVVRGAGVDHGARVRIKQPRLLPMTWEVTEVEPGSSWTWTTHAPGVTTSASHQVTAVGDGSSRVEQAIEHTGPLAPLVGFVTARLTRRYLAMEGQGLQARCEAGGAGSDRPDAGRGAGA